MHLMRSTINVLRSFVITPNEKLAESLKPLKNKLDEGLRVLQSGDLIFFEYPQFMEATSTPAIGTLRKSIPKDLTPQSCHSRHINS